MVVPCYGVFIKLILNGQGLTYNVLFINVAKVKWIINAEIICQRQESLTAFRGWGWCLQGLVMQTESFSVLWRPRSQVGLGLQELSWCQRQLSGSPPPGQLPPDHPSTLQNLPSWWPLASLSYRTCDITGNKRALRLNAGPGSSESNEGLGRVADTDQHTLCAEHYTRSVYVHSPPASSKPCHARRTDSIPTCKKLSHRASGKLLRVTQPGSGKARTEIWFSPYCQAPALAVYVLHKVSREGSCHSPRDAITVVTTIRQKSLEQIKSELDVDSSSDFTEITRNQGRYKL